MDFFTPNQSAQAQQQLQMQRQLRNDQLKKEETKKNSVNKELPNLNSYNNQPMQPQPLVVKKGVVALVIVVLILALGAVTYLYFKERSTTGTQAEADQVAADVSKIAKVPNEKPSVANVVAADELKSKNPKFYAEVENGYKLLVYSDRVILYDPATKKIVNMALLKDDGTQANTSPTPSVSPTGVVAGQQTKK